VPVTKPYAQFNWRQAVVTGLLIVAIKFLQVFPVQAQNMHAADSLRKELQIATTDSAKIALRVKLSFAHSAKDPEKSKFYARRVIADSIDCTANQLTDVYRYLGYAYLDLNQYDSALISFKQGLRFSREIDNLPIWISTARLIASCHRAMGDVKEAFEIAFKALHLADSIQDNVQKGHLNNQIGELYREQVETEQAITHLQLAYSNFKAAKIEGGMLSAKANLALAYKQVSPEKALVIYEELLDEFQHLFNGQDSARVYSNLANINLDLHRYADAEAFLMEALKCHKRIDHPISLAYCYKELGELYKRTKRPQEVVEYAQLAWDIATKYGHHSLQYQVSKQLADAYAELGDYAKAHKYLQSFIVFQDSIRSREKIALSNELEEKYASEKKERQIILQEEQLARQKAEIENEQILRRALLIGFFLLLVIVAIVYRNYKLQNRKNEEIRQSALRIKTLQSTQSRWFTNIAHELRTPLTLILGPIKNVLRSSHADEETRSSISMAKKYGDELMHRVNEILEISRLESGKLEPHTRPTDVIVCLKQVFGSFEPYATEKGVKLDFSTDTDQFVMDIDAGKISTIVNNLVSNALKFTPTGGTVHLEFVSNSLEKDLLLIKVSDSGIGISKEDLPHIFERFYQVTAARNKSYGGSGVGLTMSQELARLHGGGITVTSELSKGSVFQLSLPASLVCEETNGVAESDVHGLNLEQGSERLHVPSGTKAKVLLVEDHADMRRFMKDLLLPYYEVSEASEGGAALKLLENEKVDLIISDVKMPGMDGLSFAKMVKKDDRQRLVPFISLTAHANEKDKLSALRTGVDDYLTKPFDAEELLLRVDNLITNAQERKRALEEQESLKSEETLSHDEQVMRQLEHLVEEHLSDSSFSVAELAEKAAMSNSSLSRYLKRMTGLTPGRFIRDIRLQEAIRLLESKRYPTIAEVVYAVGFEDVSSFSRLFKKRFGKSPSDLMKRRD